jgi:cellobiose phosphorylase
VTISQGILGIKPDYDGLRIQPCIPSSWPAYHVRRRFRGVVYDISVANPDGACCGIRSLRVDGNEVDGNLVPVAPGVERVEVEVVLGRSGAAQQIARHDDASPILPAAAVVPG